MACKSDDCSREGDICEAGKYYRDQIMSFLKTGWAAALLLTGFLLTLNPNLINYNLGGASKKNALILIIGIFAANLLWIFILGLFYSKAKQHNHPTVPALWKILLPCSILFLYGVALVFICTNIMFSSN